MCLQYLGLQMLLPRRAGFITSVTAEEGEIWEANDLPSAREQAMDKLTPSKIGSIPMTVSCWFLYWISLLTNKTEFLLKSAEVRVVFKTQWTLCQLMPNLNHSQIRLRPPAEPTFTIHEIHRAHNSFPWKPPVPRQAERLIFNSLLV